MKRSNGPDGKPQDTVRGTAWKGRCNGRAEKGKGSKGGDHRADTGAGRKKSKRMKRKTKKHTIIGRLPASGSDGGFRRIRWFQAHTGQEARTPVILPAVVASATVIGAVAVAIGLFAIALQFFPLGFVQGPVAVGAVRFLPGVVVPVSRPACTIARFISMVVVAAAMGDCLQGRNKPETNQDGGGDQKTAS